MRMHWLTHAVAGSPVTYLIVLVAVVFDGLIPLVPSEATIVTASVLAAHGHLSIELIVLAAACGAVAGDNLSYWLGRGLGGRASRRLFRGEKGRRRLEWAAATLRGRAWIVTVGRFIPGGRTATTFAAGTLGMSWRTFIAVDALGAALWSVYAAALGYLGGDEFRHSLWKPLVVALAVGFLIAVAVEVGRRVSARRGSRERSERPPVRDLGGVGHS
jgi:membrane-associated protein